MGALDLNPIDVFCVEDRICAELDELVRSARSDFFMYTVELSARSFLVHRLALDPLTTSQQYDDSRHREISNPQERSPKHRKHTAR